MAAPTQQQIDDATDAVAASAEGGVRSVTDDGVVIVGHSLPDQIAAARFLKEQQASAGSPFGALKRAKIKPPNALGGC